MESSPEGWRSEKQVQQQLFLLDCYDIAQDIMDGTNFTGPLPLDEEAIRLVKVRFTEAAIAKVDEGKHDEAWTAGIESATYAVADELNKAPKGLL